MSTAARRYYDRGLAALKVGELETAAEALRSAVDLAPGFANARIAYAVATARSGDCPRAAAILRTGIARAGSAKAAAAMQCTLGDVLVLGGDFFAAEEAFNHARTTPGFGVRAASGLARVAARMGRFGEMANLLRRAATTG